MIAILATLVIATSGQSPQGSMLREVVPKPTGFNGYEDYLRAADMLTDQLGTYLNWNPDRYEQLVAAMTPDSELSAEEKAQWERMKPSKEEVAFAKRLDGMTRLEVHREAVARFGKALDLVAEGNRKRVWDPRSDVNAATLFPEFSRFKSLAKLADMAAFVAFADGQSLRGTKYLLNAYQLGVNLESGVLISNLVGVAIESIALAGIERHLDSISRADAAIIEATAPNLLAGRPRILGALDTEQQMTLNGLAQALKGGEMMELSLWGSESEDESMKALAQQMKALTQEARAGLLERGRRRLEASLIPVRKRFAGPESGWITKPTTGGSEDEELASTPANPMAFVDMVVDSTAGLWVQVGNAAAKARTQLRLLGLSAAVIRYKWDHGKMPSTLAEAVDEKRMKDPLSEGEFQYERQGAWGFRVFSKGAPGIGEIGLKYRRPQSLDPGPDGPPPPLR